MIILIIMTTCFSARLWNPPRYMHRKLNADEFTSCNSCLGTETWLGQSCALQPCIGSELLHVAGYATYLLLRARLDSAWDSGSALCAGCWYLQWLAPAHMDPRDRALEPSFWLSAELCSMNCSPSGNCTQATTLIEEHCTMHQQIWSCSCDQPARLMPIHSLRSAGKTDDAVYIYQSHFKHTSIALFCFKTDELPLLFGRYCSA